MKICLLKWRDPIMNELCAAFRRLGHEVHVFDLEVESYQEAGEWIENGRPDFVLTNNYYVFDVPHNGHLFESFLRDLKIPTIVWFFESPLASGSNEISSRWLKNDWPSGFHFCFSDSFFSDFAKAKGARASFLPLAIPRDLLTALTRSELEAQFHGQSIYVGTPFQGGRLNPQSLDGPLELFQREFWAWATTGKAWQREDIREWNRIACHSVGKFFNTKCRGIDDYNQLLKSYHQEFQSRLPSEVSSLLESFQGRLDFVYSWFHLARYIAALSQKGLRVYGGDAWAHNIPHYAYPTPRLSSDELLAAYRGASSVFCQTKYQFRNLVHDRVLAVSALGGLPITDRRRDFDWFFDGENLIPQYESLEEAESLIDYFRRNPDEKNRRSDRARRMIQARHTYDHRAAQLAQIATQEFGVSSRFS